MTQIDVLAHNYEGDDDRFFKKRCLPILFFHNIVHFMSQPIISATKVVKGLFQVPHCALIGSLFYCFVSCFFLHFFCISICTSLLITVKLPIGDFIWGTLILLYDHHWKKVFPLFLFFIQQNKLKFIKTLI